MTPFLKNMLVIARRDFLAIVATPTFLLFLLAPLFMVGMGLAGGMGASQLADSARGTGRIVAVVDAADVEALRAADARLRDAFTRDDAPPPIEYRIAGQGSPDPLAITREKGTDTYAVMTGPLGSPRIVERNAEGSSGRYLTLLVNQVRRDRAAGEIAPVTPRFESIQRGGTSIAVQQSLGFGAVFIIFLLTLLLAGQTVSSLAEEKGNKVIEILAAAVPLESVFLGKLLGFLGVAVLFIAFWMAMALAGGLIAATQLDPAALATAQSASKATAALGATPATGWPFFLGIGFVYFILSFLLLGAVFLGVGAQAATVREIQMLSLPITIFQVGMFSLSTAAASAPGSSLSTIAQIFPFSSPLAMAARAATDDSKSVHLLALGWQAIWVALVIFISVRLFRAGVLSSGSGWKFWRRRGRAAALAATAAAATAQATDPH
ncbi:MULTISPECIES: ABC transporter permease [unclassified Sphingopyxis]|jgi:ABC-2 type transport system permease protein|uniref:ABC transporter permease n=1 Tax=unclassified Sphingopyxis TaxID=2614943 RepID=UPI00285F5E04|nr:MULTISPECIES: ABC transporter permease [unclassified Sphingopyxis]MDR6833390.1 ABC-2 type transport system permease protein [Sphingopyxis sp. BE122]MDR7225659.1 ABC-2 type transport system permease protein [Sphingopyxis sp. BE259]